MNESRLTRAYSSSFAVQPLLALLITSALSLPLMLPLSGISISSFVAGLFIAAILGPPLALTSNSSMQQLLMCAAVVDGVALTWLFVAATPALTLMQWLGCYIVLSSFSLAVVGVALLLRRILQLPVAASAVTVGVFVGWLSWPVWMSPWLSTGSGWIDRGYPPFALNKALMHLGLWTHQPVMYRLTALGQDIPYSLPRSVWPAVVSHAAIGGCLIWLASWRSCVQEREPFDPQARSITPQER